MAVAGLHKIAVNRNHPRLSLELETFVRAITDANEYMADGALRRFQYEIATSGRLPLPAPSGAGDASVTGCHIRNLGGAAHGNLGVAYRIEGAPPVWILSSELAKGFPIGEVFSADEDKVMWSVDDSSHAGYPAWRAELVSLERQKDEWGLKLGGSTPGVILGHPNFAHHYWNELPALAALNGIATANGTSLRPILTLYQPLLPIDELPLVAPPDLRQIEGFDGLTGLQDTTVTRLGSTRIPTQLRRALVAVLRKRAVSHDKYRKLTRDLGDVSRIFWLSARTDARTAGNLWEFLAALIQTLDERYPGSCFLIDGFSYPADFQSELYVLGGLRRGAGEAVAGALDGRDAIDRETAIRREIDAFIASMPAKLEPRLSNLSGVPLAVAISLAEMADYYVCHQGTLQHKIAWFHNTPGTVHGNQAGLWPAAARWLAEQLDDGKEPSLLRKNQIVDCDTNRLPSRAKRNRDYLFRSVDSAVEEVVANVHRSLEGVSGPHDRDSL